jgi:hypothetical protein
VKIDRMGKLREKNRQKESDWVNSDPSTREPAPAAGSRVTPDPAGKGHTLDQDPFEPKPLAEHQARYARAIDHVHIRDEGDPGEHLFDFDDGLRLLIVRQEIAGSEVLYISASIAQGSAVWNACETGQMRREEFTAAVVERFRALSSDPRPMHFMGFMTRKRVPTWTILIPKGEHR